MSGKALRQFLRRRRPRGNHWVCYSCDEVAPAYGVCNQCGSAASIARCLGHCVEDVAEIARLSALVPPRSARAVH